MKDILTVGTWNLGMGNGGAQGMIDGISSNSDKIKNMTMEQIKIINETDMDIVALQEIGSSFLNAHVNTAAMIKKQLSQYNFDYYTYLRMRQQQLIYGKANLVHKRLNHIKKVKHIISEDQCFDKGIPDLTFLERQVLKMAIPIFNNRNLVASIIDLPKGKVAALNVHLTPMSYSPFQKKRIAEFKKIIEIACEYYKNGYYVILNGDFNFSLDPTKENRSDVFPDELKDLLNTIGAQFIFPDTATHAKINKKNEIVKESIFDGFILFPGLELDDIKVILPEVDFDHLTEDDLKRMNFFASDHALLQSRIILKDLNRKKSLY